MEDFILFNEHFVYVPETGKLLWKKNLKEAGYNKYSGNNKYRNVFFLKRNYASHRIIWLLVYGEWPKLDIDHINGNGFDNRIENLREVSVRENSQNRKVHRNGKLVGCSYRKDCKKWQALCYVNGKLKHLGYYDTEQQAHNAYMFYLKNV